MKQISGSYPLKLIPGFLAAVVIALLCSGCGSLVRVEYQNPKFGVGAVEFTLPKQGGYAK